MPGARPVNVPLLLGVLGLISLFGASLLLRSLGRGYRVARLLAAAPEVTIAEALALAATGEQRFVRVRGRVTSDEEFPDEHDRPLVFRRERLEILRLGRRGGRRDWETIQEDRVAVPFGIELRSARIAVDIDSIGTGLVVLPREASGRAAEVAGRLPEDLPGDTEVRLRVEQVSAVEQATVAGVPRIGAAGEPWMTAGAGRPLIVSTMEDPAAMRLLAEGRQGLVVGAMVLIAVGLGSFAIALVIVLAGALGVGR
jgi:hypothetical protein